MPAQNAWHEQNKARSRIIPATKRHPGNGVLRDCLFVGIRSRNGRNHPVLYSNLLSLSMRVGRFSLTITTKVVNERSASVGLWPRDVRVDETGLRGDVHYLESHAATPSILEAIAKFDDIGFRTMRILLWMAKAIAKRSRMCTRSIS